MGCDKDHGGSVPSGWYSGASGVPTHLFNMIFNSLFNTYFIVVVLLSVKQGRWNTRSWGLVRIKWVGGCKALRTAQGTESVRNNVSYYCGRCFLNTYYVPDNKNSVDVISLNPYKHPVHLGDGCFVFIPILQMRKLELREAESPAWGHTAREQ